MPISNLLLQPPHRDTLAGQLVGAFVFVVAGVALDPVPAHLMLARGSALRFLLTRLVDFLNVPDGALVRPKDPLEYVRKLRFQQGVAGIRDYGVETPGLPA